MPLAFTFCEGVGEHHMKSGRTRAAALAAAIGAWACGVWAAPPIENYTKKPRIYDVVPSPSGERLAVIVAGSNGRRQLAVWDMPPVAPPKAVAGYSDADITEVQWVNEERLV